MSTLVREGATAAHERGRAYRRYLLLTLAAIFAFNNVDRLALGIVLQDIKLDLNLTDTQLGFLTGIAFALFYSIMGIPIARWADRSNRVMIIAITTALWSAAVAACGLAVNFIQLLAIRVGVAVGEAGCLPSGLSLISDHFSRAERPRAISLFLQGGSFSLVLGYFVAGWLNQLYGWRATFVWMGLPGLILALIAWLTLKEPRRMQAAARSKGESLPAVSLLSHGNESSNAAPPPDFGSVCRLLWKNRTFRHLLFFYLVMTFFNIGIVQWQPAFLIRSFHLTTGELGSWSALVCGAGMMLGLYLGGEWASRRAAGNERLQLRMMALAWCSVGITSSLIYVSPNRYWAFAFMGIWNIVGTTTSGPLNATIQTLVPERMRATAMTLVMLFANLFGVGLGPLAVGALSDLLRPLAQAESLRYALLVLSPGYLWGAWHLWRASKTVSTDLASIHRAMDDVLA